MANTFYTTEAIAGVDFTSTPTAPEFAPGTIVKGSDGTEWMYVMANGAIAQYDCVGIDETLVEAASITKAMADDGWLIGFAQSAFADNDYGWVALRGANSSLKCNVLTSCAADVALYTSATAGSLDDSSSGTTKIDGVVAVTAVTASAETPIIATWPKSTTF